MEPIFLYDTTLRDGTQGENINFSADEKIRIAQKLDDIGIHYIEGGWPGSNPKDMRFFEKAKKVELKNAKLTAFGATRRPGIDPARDENLEALLKSDTPVVTIFGKTWTLHIEKVMKNTLEENLSMIFDSVSFLRSHNREVLYDAEHFFDGYKDNAQYALETLAKAIEAGADTIVLCDTNGGTLPFEVEKIIDEVKKGLKVKLKDTCQDHPLKIGIHTHNDSGLAVANSIIAVNSGAVMVQGTINGYGERTGNADLTSIIPILRLKMNRACLSKKNLTKLKSLSRFVSEIANIVPRNDRPFVGKSAFAHKGGIHVNAVMKATRAYEHIDPESVGNERRVLISDLSGKSNVMYKAQELGINLDTNSDLCKEIVKRIKRLENEGYEYETADASFKILLQKCMGDFNPLFQLESFRVSIEKNSDQPCTAHATIKMSVNGQEEITAAEGSGPVSALDNALRKSLCKFYPDLDTMKLVDFKVRVIDGRRGTAAKVRVFTEFRDQDHIWNTIGVSEDIIEASWQALAESVQHKLSMEKEIREKKNEF